MKKQSANRFDSQVHVFTHEIKSGPALLLADAVFGVLQTEPFVEGQLDPHVTGRHQPPDHGGAPGIRVREVRALEHSLPSHCCDLLLVGILHSCSQTNTKRKSQEDVLLILRWQHSF